MPHYRYRLVKKIGHRALEIKYGQGCACSWLTMQLRIPEGVKDADYIRKILSEL